MRLVEAENSQVLLWSTFTVSAMRHHGHHVVSACPFPTSDSAIWQSTAIMAKCRELYISPTCFYALLQHS